MRCYGMQGLALAATAGGMELHDAAAVVQGGGFGFPCVAVDDFKAGGEQAFDGLPLGKGFAPVLPRQVAEKGITHAEVPLIPQEAAGATVSEGNGFGVHYRISKARGDELVAHVVHVEEQPQRRRQPGPITGEAKLLQGIGAEGAEGKQAIHPQNPVQLLKGR